ncbi:MAG: hypothetical protein NT069_05335 [Planctomycetota bacterium]|nr:hypothetical protein [Planctomycetota bacterium]
MKPEPFAYVIDGHDNDSYAFRAYPSVARSQRLTQQILPDFGGVPSETPKRCEKCGMLLDKWHELLPGLRLRKRDLDLSSTYDGVMVASARFRDFYLAGGFSGLEFTVLPSDPTFFSMNSSRIVEFDAIVRGTQFAEWCETCRKWKSVAGATPAFLKTGFSISGLEFVRTDVEFGYADEQHPLLICGVQAAQSLKKSGFRRLELQPILA